MSRKAFTEILRLNSGCHAERRQWHDELEFAPDCTSTCLKPRPWPCILGFIQTHMPPITDSLSVVVSITGPITDPITDFLGAWSPLKRHVVKLMVGNVLCP